MTDYMKEFIEDNIELIEAGKLERLLNKCNIGYRAELKDILDQIQAEKANESGYRRIDDVTAFGNELHQVLRDLNLHWNESYMNNGKNILTYKFVGVYGPINREYQIERDIQNKLDEMNVKYDSVIFNSSEYVTVNMRSFHTSTLRIRIIK